MIHRRHVDSFIHFISFRRKNSNHLSMSMSISVDDTRIFLFHSLLDLFVMANDQQHRSADIYSCRFGSGQVLPLPLRIIQQIPYLDGLVSFAQQSSTAFDADGHLKLDSNIDFQPLLCHHRCLTFPLTDRSTRSSGEIQWLGSHSSSYRLSWPSSDTPTHFGWDRLDLSLHSGQLHGHDLPSPRSSEDEASSEHGCTLSLSPDQRWLRSRKRSSARSDPVVRHAHHSSGNTWFLPILRHLVYEETRHYLHTFRPSLSQSLHPVSFTKEVKKKKKSFLSEKDEQQRWWWLDTSTPDYRLLPLSCSDAIVCWSRRCTCLYRVTWNLQWNENENWNKMGNKQLWSAFSHTSIRSVMTRWWIFSFYLCYCSFE